MKIGLSCTFVYAIRQFAYRNGWRGAFDIEGYTRFSMFCPVIATHVNYYAIEYIYGASRYDHGMIQFEADGRSKEDCVSPGRIHGFFRYTTPGVPNPHLMDGNEETASTIYLKSLCDDNVYVVIHAASTYLPWSKLEEEFVCPFKYGTAKECLYVVKAESIIGPLCAFKNYDGTGTNKNDWYGVLPQRRCAQYFIRRIDTDTM